MVDRRGASLGGRIDRDSVYRYRDLRPNRGRPLSPDGAWRAILHADIRSLDEAHQLAIARRRRADRVEARVLGDPDGCQAAVSE